MAQGHRSEPNRLVSRGGNSSVDEITVALEKLIDLGKSFGPGDDPVILYRVAETQDHLLKAQKETVARLREHAKYRAMLPRFDCGALWISPVLATSINPA
jgi:hypothetical protein